MVRIRPRWLPGSLTVVVCADLSPASHSQRDQEHNQRRRETIPRHCRIDDSPRDNC